MSRRGRGEGTIVKRSDGRWVGAVSLPNGRRKWIYGRTRKEVSDRMASLVGDIKRGLPVTNERRTVGEFLEEWLIQSASSAVRASTYRSYRDIVRLHLVPELGGISLAKLQPQHVERMLQLKLASGLSRRRVQYIHAVLRRALGRGVRWGILGRNVATLVDAPRPARPEVVPFSPQEIARLLAAVEGDRLEGLYVLALGLGLRQGELLGLNWADLDMENRTLAVRRSLQRVDGKVRLEEPKSVRSRRRLMVPAALIKLLQAHRSRQVQERLMAGSRWEEQGLVFTTATGRPLDGTNVTRRFQRILAGAGLPRRRFHDLRHSCATVLLLKRVPARVVMETLGHSQISVTMDTYSHVLAELQSEVAQTMEAFLGQHGR